MLASYTAWIYSHRKITIVVALLLIVGFYGAYRPLPKEIGMEGTVYTVPDTSVTFLSDETYLDASGERVYEQHIFDAVLTMVHEADHYILVDMFLWNTFQGANPELHRALSTELTDALVRKKSEAPWIVITVITDPINTVYDGQPSTQFDALRNAGIPVILTDHSALRDSNPLYSTFWRTFLQWPDMLHTLILGKPYTFRWLPNVMDSGGEEVTLRSYLKLFNFKANHRKLIVADRHVSQGHKLVTLVTSANPHDGSSAHSNVALMVEDSIWQDVVRSEQAVAAFSDGKLPVPDIGAIPPLSGGTLKVQLITEEAIQRKVVSMLTKAGAGDTVELAIFYLSEDGIIDGLVDAANRGADVRVILDPNKDAFGIEKNGVPNRSVAAKLIRESDGKIQVRWCSTHGEQCHTKILLVQTNDSAALTLGSANFTRRNLMNLNLESNVWVESEKPSTAYSDAHAYFERMWNNENGREYTVDYGVFKDESRSKRLMSWVMEHTGLSTF